MADVKWIKICTDIFNDEKVVLIEDLPDADGIIVIWFKLLCLAGKQNNGGVFMLNDKIAYTDEMLATIFRRPINTVRLALSTFEQFGMVEIVNNTITIPNWEKHQTLDKFEQAKEQTRKRVAKHREKQKALVGGCNADVTLPVTLRNADRIEEDKEEEIEEEVVVDAHDGDGDKLEQIRGGVLLTENQLCDLLDKMGLAMFDEYVGRLADFITSKNAHVGNHYATILKWYNEDRAVKN